MKDRLYNYFSLTAHLLGGPSVLIYDWNSGLLVRPYPSQNGLMMVIEVLAILKPFQHDVVRHLKDKYIPDQY